MDAYRTVLENQPHYEHQCQYGASDDHVPRPGRIVREDVEVHSEQTLRRGLDACWDEEGRGSYRDKHQWQEYKLETGVSSLF